MKQHLQLILNPGSTSTKIAVYRDSEEVFTETIRHSTEQLAPYSRISDQFEFRKTLILDALKQRQIALPELSAIVVRGGLLNPLEGGTYEVNELMCSQLTRAINGEHASNLGALIGRSLAVIGSESPAREKGDREIPCYTVDPVVVDEMMDEARPTGIPGIERRSIFHALNQKAIARRAAADLGKHYADVDLIVAHLGGGISVGAHQRGRVIETNNALNGDGPITPERAGTVPAGQLVELCFSGTYTQTEIMKLLTGKGGLVAHLGTNDGREMAARVERGDGEAIRLTRATAFTIAKEIGQRAVALRGHIDAIVLTGSMVYFEQLVTWIQEYAGFLGPFLLYPGEDEMLALSQGGLRILNGEESPKQYTSEG